MAMAREKERTVDVNVSYESVSRHKDDRLPTR